MPKTIADERIRLVLLPEAPANPNQITLTELNAAGVVELSSRVLMSDFKLTATASDTVSEPALSEGGNSGVPGKSNYEGSLTPFRYLTGAGLADPTNDVAYAALKEKGTELHLVKRVGPHYTDAWDANQEIEYYHAITDNPQDPSEFTGYLKKVVPLFVQGDSEVLSSVVSP